MLTETIFEDPRWEEADLEAWSERAARAALNHLGIAPEGYEIAVLGCDDDRIATLNADFRGKPRPTNVLSWPSEDLAAENPGETPEPPPPPDSLDAHHLGDLALSYDVCRQEAAEGGREFEHHVTHLLVHGVLHLLGYDHIRDEDATLMEALETTILGNLGIADPYNRM